MSLVAYDANKHAPGNDDEKRHTPTLDQATQPYYWTKMMRLISEACLSLQGRDEQEPRSIKMVVKSGEKGREESD